MNYELSDLHCHILPGIDDGAENIEQFEKMVHLQIEQGVTNMVFTPHFYPERVSFQQFVEARRKACSLVKPILGNLDIGCRVGAEVYYTPLIDRMDLKKLAFLGTRYILLELWMNSEPLDVEETITRIKDKGFVPILAHVERFDYIKNNPELLYRWIKAGALGQVNSGWVLHDKNAIKRLQQYYNWGLIHLMASDAHSITRRPPNLVKGIELLPENIAAYFVKNSEAIFNDACIEKNEMIKPKKVFGKWK